MPDAPYLLAIPPPFAPAAIAALLAASRVRCVGTAEGDWLAAAARDVAEQAAGAPSPVVDPLRRS